jgi:prepilin-type N-terminal cleavage/methylation domain-containing protein
MNGCQLKQRSGLTLMEVIVSIAILGGALVVIGNLVFLGSKAASNTRWYSEAQILCDSKMAEVSAGVLPLQSTGGTPIEENPDWLYSVEIGQTTVAGLLAVTVTVQQSPTITASPTPCLLMRWLPDPDYVPEQPVLQ